jgi:hypothetical protein
VQPPRYCLEGTRGVVRWRRREHDRIDVVARDVAAVAVHAPDAVQIREFACTGRIAVDERDNPDAFVSGEDGEKAATRDRTAADDRNTEGLLS